MTRIMQDSISIFPAASAMQYLAQDMASTLRYSLGDVDRLRHGNHVLSLLFASVINNFRHSWHDTRPYRPNPKPYTQ